MANMTEVFDGADVSSYDADLNQGLSLSGEDKSYFMNHRLLVLKSSLVAQGCSSPRRIMDFGCAAGETTEKLSQQWPDARIIGVDTSETLIAAAKETRASERCEFCLTTDLSQDVRFDLIYCNGVFHHIEVAVRTDVLNWLKAHLAPDGCFALWENNCWNPGTRLIMSRVPFDRTAVPLSPVYASSLLRAAGFHILSREFHFIFPRQLKAFRPLERWLRFLPIGGQYQILVRR